MSFPKLYVDLPSLLPALIATALVAIALWCAYFVLIRRAADRPSAGNTSRQIIMLLLVLVGIVSILLALPIHEATRGQLLSLFSVALTAVIALASTTFIANAMAGTMLRMVKSFRVGDFVRAGEHFGRVTERGLFHTEIQTEDRDLTTIPNLHLVSNPLTVVRASGTIVSATLSLGYDVAHTRVIPLLVEAATTAGLQDPFVRIVDLGDFSVTYRVAGFLEATKQLLTMRSKLREMILDTLHAADVEIVSPTFMNQRILHASQSIIPQAATGSPVHPAPADVQNPEELIFDKANEAEKIEDLRQQRATLLDEIQELESQASAVEKDRRSQLEHAIQRRRERADVLEAQLAAAEEKRADDD